jgi:LmbE family N-acetylglucosaminyl deacetylase
LTLRCISLTILSPHLDDAAFSLCIALREWSKTGVQLRVVNFFSISDYAPKSLLHSIIDVSAIRKAEDLRALRLISCNLQIESLDLLDAPLRLGLDLESVCKPESGALRHRDEIDRLALRLRKYFLRGYVLAPLGLGNHVDHLTVRAAAIANFARRRLGFYEDLPYAIRASAAALNERLSEVQDRTGVRLRSILLCAPHAASFKQRVASRYHSQISREEAAAIARFSARYSGGERIWIPQNAQPWRHLVG